MVGTCEFAELKMGFGIRGIAVESLGEGVCRLSRALELDEIAAVFYVIGSNGRVQPDSTGVGHFSLREVAGGVIHIPEGGVQVGGIRFQFDSSFIGADGPLVLA